MVIAAITFVAALVVLAEALNKLERSDMAQANCPRTWAVLCSKVLGWALLAVGSAGVLVQPLLGMPMPNTISTCVLSGFALLIVRTRLKDAGF